MSVVKAAPSKLLAEWFWTDRWMGSSGFLLPMLARGVYREMLTQAWRRGAKLPNDFQSIQRAIGCTSTEWAEAWPLVSRFWRIDADNNFVNDTQLEIYREALELQEKRSEAGKIGAASRWQPHNGRNADAIANSIAKPCPPSPSPSPSLITVSDAHNKLVPSTKPLPSVSTIPRIRTRASAAKH